MIKIADIERKMGILAKDKEMQEAYKQKKMRFYLSAKMYLETEPSLEYLIAKARELQDKKDAANLAIDVANKMYALNEVKKKEVVDEITKNHRLSTITEQLLLIKFLLG